MASVNHVSLREYLAGYREDQPAWLRDFRVGGRFSLTDFLASRVIYYPGSGIDGHPVELFGSSHSAHCFVYVDRMETEDSIQTTLDDAVRGFRGYRTLERLRLTQRDLFPDSRNPPLHHERIPMGRRPDADPAPPFYAFLEILERNDGLDDTHGANRLAILFLRAEGADTYDKLFCQTQGVTAPFAILLQDDFCTYRAFGRGGLLENVATRVNVLPTWLLVGDNTEPWDGFEPVPHVDREKGGRHSHWRVLYGRSG